MARPFPAALAAAMLLSPSARADPVPQETAWAYNFTPDAASLAADGNPSAGVGFSNGATLEAVGDTRIVATELRVSSTASADAPDVLTAAGYTLTLRFAFTDSYGLHYADPTFHGTLSGTFSSAGANIENTFGPDATQTMRLGSMLFEVSLNEYRPPGPPDQDEAGYIAAYVSLRDASPAWGPFPQWGETLPPWEDPPQPESLPEPSSAALATVGLLCAAWRMRRRVVSRDDPVRVSDL
jgi:hypothetical protein